MPRNLPDATTVRRHAREMHVVLSGPQAEQLLAFGELLLQWNRAFSIVSRKDADRIYERHLLDSLSVAPWVGKGRTIDIGTGPGLPGIPLAIACPDASFMLVDRNARRIRLIGQAVRELGIVNIETFVGDIRDLATRERYHVAVSRAVTGPAALWQMARPLLEPAGTLVVMARAAAATTEPDDSDPVGSDTEVEQHRIAVPGLAIPHLLLVVRSAG